MAIRPVGERGLLYTFDDDISVYLIAGLHCSIICDTHLGPDSMEEIRQFMASRNEPDRILVFNSHSDWDHIWGNCAFPNSCIIAHETCRQRMLERGSYDLGANRGKTRGPVTILPPCLTFSNRLTLEDEGVEFWYAPGHTVDSSVCYDRRDSVLYLGDLAEDPIPYLDDEDLNRYLATLHKILDHQAEVLVSAHSGVISRDLVRKNIRYISAVRDGNAHDDADYGDYAPVHRWNLNQRIVLRYDPLFRKVLQGRYSPVFLLELAGDLHTRSASDLEDDLKAALSRLQE